MRSQWEFGERFGFGGLSGFRQPLSLFLLSFLQVTELGWDLMVERRVGKRFGRVGIESGKEGSERIFEGIFVFVVEN